MKSLRFAVLVLVLIMGLSGMAHADRIALVIGNGAYPESPLSNAVNDARDMKKALHDLGFTTVVYAEDADIVQMKRKADEFISQLEVDSEGVFYFSGHGAQVDGSNYLIPLKSGIRDEVELQHYAFDVGLLLDKLRKRGNRFNLVILDACRDNPFKGFKAQIGGLASMSGPEGTMIAFASAPNTSASNNKSGKNSLFTKHLLLHISEPGLKVEDLWKKVRLGVIQDSPNPAKPQTPWENGSLMGDFCFAGCAGAVESEAEQKLREAEEIIRQYKERERQAQTTPPSIGGEQRDAERPVDRSRTELWERSESTTSLGDLDEAERLYLNKKYSLALPLYRKLAEAGDGFAQFRLGSFSENGLGVSKDWHEAAAWFERSAKSGDAFGQYNFGRANRSANGGHDEAAAQQWEDRGKANGLREKAKILAQRGDPMAQFIAGRIAYSEKRYPEALAWYRKAAEQGDAKAQGNLGAFYFNGIGVKKDPAQAVVWYRKAAEQGNAWVQNELGGKYEKGDGVDKDSAQAVEWYRKSAEQGFAEGQKNLGLMYYAQGDGVQKDSAKAVAWFRKAAEQGLARGQYLLGLMYAKGDGVEKDSAKAVEWYTKAAEQGDVAAQMNLGRIYEIGDGVDKDSAKAVEWYSKAAEQGLANAQASLANMYFEGNGVKKDAVKALAWNHKALEQRNAAVEAVVQNNIAAIYANGGEGVEKDPAKAVRGLRKAAEQGAAVAQYNLGSMYHNGDGVEKNPIQAVAWFRKAAEQGYAVAQYNLGVMFANGSGVEKDPTQAVAWYRKAAEQGDAMAQAYLGVMYANGNGVEKDPTQAVAWFRKAANQGNANAQSNLGVMYETGKGVENDQDQAITWYRKAAAGGDENAKKSLARLGVSSD